MRKYILVLLCLLPVVQNAQVMLDLKSCLNIGLERNYDIRIARNDQQITDNNATIGNAGYLPTIDLGSGYSGALNNTKQNLRDGTSTSSNDIHNQTLNAGVNLNWMIFDGFNIQTNYKKLKELQSTGELRTRLSIENFVADLTSEYYNYIQQTIHLKNLRSAVKLSKERLRIAQVRYEIGETSRLDMQQAKVDFNSDSSKYVIQQEVLYASRIRLNKMMATEDIDQPIQTADTIIAFDDFLDKETIWQKTLSSNTILLLSGKEKNIGLLDLKSAQSENYPYLRLNTGYGITKNIYNTGTIDNQRNLGLTYGLTLGFNLFDGSNRKRKQNNAKAIVRNRELEYEQTVLSLKADLSNIWMAYRNNLELYSLERENVETARDNYEIAIYRYKLQDLAGIELREAQNSLLEAEERLVRAEYNTKLCEISLMQISGQVALYIE